MQDIDWKQIKTEYITGKMSYRKLSEKYNVPESTLSRRGKEEKWVLKRRQHCDKVVAKSTDKIARKEAARLAKLRTAADAMAEVINGIFVDEQQFHRHIVQRKEKGIKTDETLGVYKYEMEEAEEKIFPKYDTKAIRELTAAMKDLTAILRDLYGVPNMQQVDAMRIAQARLELDQQKNTMDMDREDTGIVYMPSVLPDDENDTVEADKHE